MKLKLSKYLLLIFSFLLIGGMTTNQKTTKPNANIKSLAMVDYQNKQTYVTEEGKNNTILWTEGIKAPLMSSDETLLGTEGYFDKLIESSNGAIVYQSPYVDGQGFYDINKNLYENAEYEHYHCYLVAATNLIYWWLDRNKDYVDTYVADLKQGGIYEQVEGLRQIVPHNERLWNDILMPMPANELHGMKQMTEWDSKIIRNVLSTFYSTKRGYFSDRVLDFFFNGYKAYLTSDDGGFENTEENYKKDPLGGIFYHIFGKHRLTKRYEGNDYYKMKEVIKNALLNGSAMTISFNFSKKYGHAITLWGAEFDENDDLVRIYVTDSDDEDNLYDEKNKTARSMYSFAVGHNDNEMYFYSVPGATSGATFKNLVVLDQGTEYWEAKMNEVDKNPGTPLIKNESEDLFTGLNAEVNLSFDATNVDLGSLSYQWYESDTKEYNGTPIKGAIDTTYFPKTNVEGTKYYYCEVTNHKNGKKNIAKTKIYTVDINKDVVVTNAMMPKIGADFSLLKEVDQYGTYKLDTRATSPDGGELSFKWYSAPDSNAKGGTLLPNETKSYMYVPTNNPGRYFYYCEVTNTNNSVNGKKKATKTTNYAKRVEVKEKQITDASYPVLEVENIANASYKVGDIVTKLSVEAKVMDGGSLSYQWYESTTFEGTGTPIIGENKSSFTPSSTKASSKYYYCIVTNTNNKATVNQTSSVETKRALIEIKEDVIVPELDKDNYLSNIVIKNGTMSPKFDKNNQTYNVNVAHDITTLDLEVSLSSLKANYIVSSKTLDFGMNTITITVTSEAKEDRIYTLNVNRGEDHVYGDWITIQEATCTQAGLQRRTCSCGHVEERAIPKLEHNFGAWEVVKAPTCTESGIERRYCSRCDEYEERTIAPKGHRWDTEWTIDIESTCSHPGEKSHHCLDCDERKDITVISQLEHDFGAWEVVTKPTCTEDGLEHRVCSLCGTEETRVIKATGHIWDTEWTMDIEATCEHPGEKSHHCLNCDERKDVTVIPQLAHQFGPWEVVIEATPDQEGLEKRVCKVCGIEETRVVPKTSHEFGPWITVKEPTCTEPGLERRTCNKCGLVDEREIAPKGHSWSNEWTIDIEATCEHPGEKSHHCLNCDERKDITVIPQLEHEFGEWEIITSPTCETTGLKRRTCLNCDHFEEEIIPALGHDFGEWKVVKAPTCTESGIERRYCSRCDEYEERTIAPKGHRWDTEWTIDIESTCSHPGEKSHHCLDCDERRDITVIEQLEHNFGDWIIVREATTELEGIKKRVCSVCGEEVYESIPKIEAPVTPENEKAEVNVGMLIAGISIPTGLLLIGGIVLLLIKYKKH